MIGFGGAAGGGKSHLGLGLAATKHRRSVIFRREFPSLGGTIEDSRIVFNPDGNPHSDDSYNEQLHRWRLFNPDRFLQFWSINDAADLQKKKGNPFDLMVFDEATEFPEDFVRFMMGWNRTTIPNLKCQTLLTFNPPMDETQDWVIRYFAPWLDETHERPAQDGELRWYAMVEGKEVELAAGDQFMGSDGAWVQPRSRTFFHASLKDNPALEQTGYGATIDALPEPLRSLLKGNFKAGRTANPWQVIPTAWVKAAMERGHGFERRGKRLTAIGADIARGGINRTVLAPIYGNVFDTLLKYPGKSTPDGASVAGLVVNVYARGAVVGVDVVGIGSSAYDSLVELGIPTMPINAGETTDFTDRSGRLRVRNVRSAMYWLMRESLDPASGADIILPDDPELLADLTAPRYRIIGGKIEVESKQDDPETKTKGINARLGRSPDCGDAVVIGWWTNTFPVEVERVVYDPVHIGNY